MTKKQKMSSRAWAENRKPYRDTAPKVRLSTTNAWGVRFLPIPQGVYKDSPVGSRFLFDDGKLQWIEMKRGG